MPANVQQYGVKNFVNADTLAILARVGRALEESLRLNTTLTSLNLTWNRLGEGGGQALL
jgi:hypothetical protein